MTTQPLTVRQEELKRRFEQERVEIFELVSVLGLHTMTMGVPVLLDELAQGPKRGRS